MNNSVKSGLAAAMALTVSACSDYTEPENAYCTFDETTRTAKIIYVSPFKNELQEFMTIKNFKLQSDGTYIAGKNDVSVNENTNGVSPEDIVRIKVYKDGNGSHYCYIARSYSISLSYKIQADEAAAKENPADRPALAVP